MPSGNYLPHLLPVDPTLHWANPPGGTTGPRHAAGLHLDARSLHRPGAHRHARPRRGRRRRRERRVCRGLVSAGGDNIPTGYATEAPGTISSRARPRPASAPFGDPASPSSSIPNANRASTIWYHDHALGMTRLNVYAGPAGFYFIRGGPAGDAAVATAHRPSAILPGPAPSEIDQIMKNKFYEIPIAIQDRSFNADGSLFYPDTRTFFDGIVGPLTFPLGSFPRSGTRSSSAT